MASEELRAWLGSISCGALLEPVASGNQWLTEATGVRTLQDLILLKTADIALIRGKLKKVPAKKFATALRSLSAPGEVGERPKQHGYLTPAPLGRGAETVTYAAPTSVLDIRTAKSQPQPQPEPQPEPGPEPEPEPALWRAVMDPTSGRTFYIDAQGHSHWELPLGASATQAQQQSAPTAAATASSGSQEAGEWRPHWPLYPCPLIAQARAVRCGRGRVAAKAAHVRGAGVRAVCQRDTHDRRGARTEGYHHQGQHQRRTVEHRLG
eukprot:COSAG04_NODE_1132_length_8130_cov_3.223882_3_plen_266_part_00